MVLLLVTSRSSVTSTATRPSIAAVVDVGDVVLDGEESLTGGAVVVVSLSVSSPAQERVRSEAATTMQTQRMIDLPSV
jgi:hypothetical protein